MRFARQMPNKGADPEVTLLLFPANPRLVVTMTAFSSTPPGQGVQNSDPVLQPTPDYGTLGPGSDAKINASDATTTRPAAVPVAWRPIIALALGASLAALVVGAKSARPSLARITDLFGSTSAPVASSAKDVRQLNRMKPQKQAEALLQLAIANSDEARDQIVARADGWRGRLNWQQLAPLFAAALNAKDLRVRQAGIEVELAAYGLRKNSAAVDSLALAAESSDHARKIWGLWALGLMGNRGIETDRIVEILTGHLKDSDADSRRWSVEALALVGTSPTIAPLLRTMHDDPSPIVRERAACSLAESGMLTREQRLTAVPQLVSYSDDPSLDTQTHAWAFQALGDITQERLPNDSAAWRNWYRTVAASGQ
jgi:HEAT repeats